MDFAAGQDLGVPITNTPNTFGVEVADIALGYVIVLERETFQIDTAVRHGQLPKPRGISLAEKPVALVGFGDIGRRTARRLLAADMKVIAYDPAAPHVPGPVAVQRTAWHERLQEANFIVVTCVTWALTASSSHILNADTLAKAKDGVMVVNVGRGSIIDEAAVVRTSEIAIDKLMGFLLATAK